ncbi:solute carrier family 22 member 7 [Apteryx mantelli]|uniref:Solute carrier family 22 member 7 n=1 Tax=Apteryx mantelli TaxID=2696672 RepID=A0A8B7JGE0_9AVES|nr:PREDICTED: solute carrier family 22 member 7 isoform X1 [Apteryx mantelli mantelli]XP_025937391.1 solute carrier family 22 member 7 isoform X1 [Apteryx rowi]
MKFEDLLLETGGFGRFQILILFLLCLPRINLPMHFLLHSFLAATPSHHCAIPRQEAFVNLTTEELLLISIPQESDGTFRSCEMFLQPQFYLLLNSSLQPENDSIIEDCKYGWVYDHSQFTSTIATQWDLVCEQRGLNQATATFFFIGVTVGAVIFGYLSDRYGRKAMLLVSLVCSVIFGMLSAASTSYSMLAITRTLTGVALSGISLIVLPLGMEWVDVQHRTISGILTSIFWSIGNMLLAMIAYLVRDWRWLLVAVTGPCLLSIICLWWVPESARWLIANGKVKQAHRHLLRCARMNGRKDFTVSPEALRRMTTEKKSGESYSYISLFRTPVLRKISLCSGAVWFGVAFSYYGMSMNLTGFGLNMYLSQFVFGIIEIPAKLIMYVLVNRVGRRQSQAWTLILTGLCIGANIIVPKSFTSMRSVVAIMGKGFSESAFTTVFLYTSELYPTVLRQNGMGYTSFVARLGGALAPLVFLLDSVWRSLPEVTYCGMAVCCGSVAFLLPETLNVHLPEGIEDVEKTQVRGPLQISAPEGMPLQSRLK